MSVHFETGNKPPTAFLNITGKQTAIIDLNTAFLDWTHYKNFSTPLREDGGIPQSIEIVGRIWGGAFAQQWENVGTSTTYPQP